MKNRKTGEYPRSLDTTGRGGYLKVKWGPDPKNRWRCGYTRKYAHLIKRGRTKKQREGQTQLLDCRTNRADYADERKERLSRRIIVSAPIGPERTLGRGRALHEPAALCTPSSDLRFEKGKPITEFVLFRSKSSRSANPFSQAPEEERQTRMITRAYIAKKRDEGWPKIE